MAFALLALVTTPLLRLSRVTLTLLLMPYLTTIALVSGSYRFNWLESRLVGASLRLLRLYLAPLIIVSSKDFSSSSLKARFAGLLITLLVLFSVRSLLDFYVTFEFRVIPLSLCILGWGLQPERLLATIYMILFTAVRAFPFLVLILLRPRLTEARLRLSVLVCPFLVKLPIFMVHIWLPKAHVEAPVYGSMILAAIILKIGAYGLLRVRRVVSPAVRVAIGAVSSLGGALCAVVALSQSDVKALIAYSRVVHIGAVVLCTLLGSKIIVAGALLTLIAHGVASSGLFYAVTVQYSRFGSRLFPMMQGMMGLSAVLRGLWCILLVVNLRAPPTINLYSELLIFRGRALIRKGFLLPIRVLILMSLVYSLMLFRGVSHGPAITNKCSSPVSLLEIRIVSTHAFWFGLGLLWLSV